MVECSGIWLSGWVVEGFPICRILVWVVTINIILFYWIRFTNDKKFFFWSLVFVLILALVFSENSLTRSAILSFKANPFPDSFMYLSWSFVLKICIRICLATWFVRPWLTTSRIFSSVRTSTGRLVFLSWMGLKPWIRGRRRREKVGRRRRVFILWEQGGEWGSEGGRQYLYPSTSLSRIHWGFFVVSLESELNSGQAKVLTPLHLTTKLLLKIPHTVPLDPEFKICPKFHLESSPKLVNSSTFHSVTWLPQVMSMRLADSTQP